MPALNTHPVTRRDWVILLLVLFIAAVLRLDEPGISEFFHDEAMVSMLAQDMAEGKIFPTLGILSSVGIPNPPTSIYVMWLPYLLSDNPLIATVFVALLNIGGVGLLWLLAHRYWGRTAALAAGLVYALNPWAILYSRKIWAQDYHTPFLLLALLLGLYGFGEAQSMAPRRKFAAQAVCLPTLLFALQIHFAAWALLPLYLWLVWIGWRRITWRAALITAMLSLVILLPYGIGLSATLQQDPDRIRNTISRSGLAGEHSSLTLSADPLVHMARFATGLGLETWVAPEQQGELLARVPPPVILWLIVGAIVLIGIPAMVRGSHRAVGILVLLWVSLPVVIFTPTWTSVYPHYFIGSIPALALLAGAGIIQVLNFIPGKSPARPLVMGALAVILLTQGIWWRGLLRYLDTHSTPLGFTTPLHYLLDVRDSLIQYDDVLVVSDGMWVLFDKEPARWSVMLRRSARCIRTVPGDGYAVFPEGPFAAVIAPNAPPNAVNNLYLTANPTTYPTRPGDGLYSINTFDTAPSWSSVPITPITPVLFDNGVQLTGYALSGDKMYLEWRLPDAKPGQDYQYTGHFIDSAGSRLDQRDVSFWPGRHWCSGDRLITWTDLNLPENTAELHVGMYLLGTGRTEGQYFSANILDVMGNPAGQSAVIPLRAR